MAKTNRMLTRSEYLQHYQRDKNGEALHRQYYAQLVDESVIEYVVRVIGHERLLASADRYLNDIPLNEWDRAAQYFFNQSWARRFSELGDSLSLAGIVCVLKEAATQYIERQKNTN